MTKRVTFLILPIIVGLLLLFGTIQTAVAGPSDGLSSSSVVLSLPSSATKDKLATPPLQVGGTLTLEVRAATGLTATFYHRNDKRTPLISMPRLVFSQTGSFTNDISRTATITVANVQVNPGITETIAITIMTQNRDPDLGGSLGGPAAIPIVVWQDVQTRSVPVTGTAQMFDVAFSHTFTEQIRYNSKLVRTPTGYFRVDADIGGTITTFDYAFLMDNEYRADLNTAEPIDYDMLIRYYDMSPYGYDLNHHNWISRTLVPTHIVSDFVPMVRRVFYTEVHDWGMPPLNPNWRNWLGTPQLLTIDINEDDVWYHTVAGANSSMHLKSYPPTNGWLGYPDIISRQESTFYHELFHNMQVSISEDDFGSNVRAWHFVNEGTASLATTVGQPDLQFDGTYTLTHRQSRSFANSFLQHNLNQSYTITDTNAPGIHNFHYSTILYWRFLYEQCGGGLNSNQDEGMLVIWHAIAAAYNRSGHRDPDASGFEEIIDEALSGTGYDPNDDGIPDLAEPTCNFSTFDESMIAFARAIYSLRLPTSDFDEPLGEIYPEAPFVTTTHELTATNPTSITGEIATSLGIDLIEIDLTGPITSLLSLTLTNSAITQEFSIEMMWLTDTLQSRRPERAGHGALPGYRKDISPAYPNTRSFILTDTIEYVIEVDQRDFTSLAFVILRRDPNEGVGTGVYTITLDNDMGHDHDGDGIIDEIEYLVSDHDVDNDGKPNWLDLDSDGDGLPDWVEADCDGEGDCDNHKTIGWNDVPNSDAPVDDLWDFLDTDSDNDGLPDWAEAGCWSSGDCSNIVPSWSSLTGCNGITPCDTRTDWDLFDSDGDDIHDYREIDSDEDAIEDWQEAGCVTSVNCSRIRQFPSAPLLNVDWSSVTRGELENNYWPNADVAIDGIPDYRDQDSDNDHIQDVVEADCVGAALCDTDNDGEPDYRDTDSDDDHILDEYERLCTEDPTNPGFPIGLGHFEPPNLVITSTMQACDSDAHYDIDGDGNPDPDNMPDYRDINSDNDVMPDLVEAGDNDLDTDPVEGDINNNIPAFRDPDDLFVGPPPPTGGVDACLPFAGWPSGGLDEILLPWGFNRGIACGLQLIRDTLTNAGINVTIDPPVPGMLFYNHPFITADAAATAQIAVTAAHTTTSPLDASLTTGHTTIAGDFSAVWTTDAWVGTQFSVLSALDAAVYDETDTLIARGQAQVLPENGETAVALAMGDTLTYTVSGNGSAAFYAPALSTLGVGGAWNDYTAEIQANSPYGIGLQGADVIVDGQIYSGDLALVVTGTTTLQGQGQTLVPNFANQFVISATNAAVQMGPAVVLTGTLPSSVANGFALPDYTGQLTISQHTAELDQITFDGLAARDLSLTLNPPASSITPVESASFQAVIASNADDVYDVGVSAPTGWNVRINNSGLITATPPLGAQPGDYALQVTVQSAAAGEPLAATAVHTVTVTAYEGMALSVAPDPLTTVPWGQSAYAFDSDDAINNGSPQIPGAAFIATITNTSSIAHTFDVQVTPSGFSSDWILLGGTGRANSAQVSLPPGGVGQLGVYISPVGLATLPAEGTSYPFNVTATAVANPGLSETDNETFIMPAVQFAYVAVQPELIYSAPGASGAFAATVTNVGNSVESFPLSVDLPPSGWAVAAGWDAATLSPGEASTQMITITTPTGELGQTYAVGVRTLSGVYRPTAYVDVELVSPAALPIYEAVNSTRDLCAVTDHEIALPAALEALALSVTELDDSCQEGNCALDLRDRVVADLRDVADYTQLAHWTSTTAVSLRQLAASMETHTDQAAISGDIVAVGNQITQLETEFCALSAHDLSLSFTPSVVAILDDGSVADYTLEVVNQGDMATTAVISLTVPTGAAGSWSNQSIPLAPGQFITIPTTITPSQRGVFVINADATTVEAPAIQRQAQAGLNVVDAYLRVIRVTADPSFVDTGTSSTNLSVDIANVANVPRDVTARAQILAPTGALTYTADVPLSLLMGDPRSYDLGAVNTLIKIHLDTTVIGHKICIQSVLFSVHRRTGRFLCDFQLLTTHCYLKSVHYMSRQSCLAPGA